MFIARKNELNEINEELENTSRKIVIYEKRRVGKTSLIKKVIENRPNCIYFECIQDTLESNLRLFKITVNKLISIPSYVSFESFEQIFEYLNSLNIKFTIIFDEYPYLKKNE